MAIPTFRKGLVSGSVLRQLKAEPYVGVRTCMMKHATDAGEVKCGGPAAMNIEWQDDDKGTVGTYCCEICFAAYWRASLIKRDAAKAMETGCATANCGKVAVHCIIALEDATAVADQPENGRRRPAGYLPLCQECFDKVWPAAEKLSFENKVRNIKYWLSKAMDDAGRQAAIDEAYLEYGNPATNRALTELEEVKKKEKD